MHLRSTLLAAGLAGLSLLALGCASSGSSGSPTREPYTLIPVPSSSGSTQPPADPEAVQAAVEKRLRKSMAVTNRIDVKVDKNGVALLTGFVGSNEEIEQAVRVASATEGVTAVAQDLRVAPLFNL